MCGIAAIIGAGSSEKLLKEVLAPIAHRGDHQNEIRVFDKIALGTNRLAIVDRVGAVQPVSNEGETVFAIQNGEIFNYKELTVDLKAKGHTFKTDSDTEVLVHLWEEYRERMLEHIDSEMFAFVIYDKATETVFAARDRIGVKPLFYGTDAHKNLIFASEMKALTSQCEEIHEFPEAQYFLNGTFTPYYTLPNEDSGITQAKAESQLATLIESAVAKRVQTDLPIAVFLSGGVDSSLVMELAHRHHPDVTGLILGFTDSPDYINAVQLCTERGWKYKVIEPEIDYTNELEQVAYFVESYDPNIVRHSFANDTISRFAAACGYKVILTGEGSDELFGGYNEFLELDPSKINQGCRLLLESMPHGNLSRIDKPAMRYSIEARCPFFDTAVVELAMRLTGDLKVGMHEGKRFTKLILREVASQFLPSYIAFREKVPFANGAGMDIGVNYKKGDGVLSSIAEHEISDEELRKYQTTYPEYSLVTKEEVLYFRLYEKFSYTKLVGGNKRLLVKDTLTEL